MAGRTYLILCIVWLEYIYIYECACVCVLVVVLVVVIVVVYRYTTTTVPREKEGNDIRIYHARTEDSERVTTMESEKCASFPRLP